jgi:initiation factor 1A
MVKNTQGGSSHKKFARKFSSGGASNNNNRLRVSEDEGEIYAIVTKMLGNGMFHCHCLDNQIRLGHIRGKFSGRGRRDNTVEGGKWVLIGLREWDIPSEKTSTVLKSASSKMQKCDLLEVYSDSDKYRLKETISENWQILDTNDVSRDAKENAKREEEDGFVFGTDRDFEREKLISEMKSSTAKKITLNLGEDTEQKENIEEEINFDDI